MENQRFSFSFVMRRTRLSQDQDQRGASQVQNQQRAIPSQDHWGKIKSRIRPTVCQCRSKTDSKTRPEWSKTKSKPKPTKVMTESRWKESKGKTESRPRPKGASLNQDQDQQIRRLSQWQGRDKIETKGGRTESRLRPKGARPRLGQD